MIAGRFETVESGTLGEGTSSNCNVRADLLRGAGQRGPKGARQRPPQGGWSDTRNFAKAIPESSCILVGIGGYGVQLCIDREMGLTYTRSILMHRATQ